MKTSAGNYFKEALFLHIYLNSAGLHMAVPWETL